MRDTRGTPDAEALVPRTEPAAGPYVGLRPYEPSERDRFFGRNQDALFLCNKILSARLTILYSQSGLGKSSLLRTLVIPRLEEDGPVIYFEAWSQDAPLAALKEKLAKHASTLGVPSPDAGAPTLTQLVRLIRTEDARPLTLVLDQFEEFLIAHGHQLDQLRAELAELTRTTQIDVQIVLSLREEFLAALEPFRDQILSLFQSTYRLEGLDAESLRDAIRLPPRVFNGSCDEELVEILIRDLKSRSQGQQDLTAIGVELPMLQLVCSELWNEVRRAGQSTLTVPWYEKAGGVNKILDRYVTVSMPRRWSDQVLAARLMRLLAPPSGVKMAYSAADLAENVGSDKDSVERLLDELAGARILQTRHSKRGRRYELQHDAFIGVITPWRDQVLTRRVRIRQTLVTLSVVAGLLLIVLIGAFLDRSYRAAAERQSTLRDLINHVENDLESRPTFNLLLATTAYALGRSEDPELQGPTESALRRALSRVGGLPFADPGTPAASVCVNRDGSRLVTAGRRGMLIWDVDSRTGNLPGPAQGIEPRPLTNDGATQCVMSADGRWLATTAGGKGVRIWNLRELSAKPIDIPVSAAESAITFSADEQWLAVGLTSGDVEVWNVGSPGQPVRRMTLSPPATLTSATPYAARFGPPEGEPFLFVAYEGQIDEQRHGVVLRWAVGVGGASAPEVWWMERTDRGYIAMAFGEDARWLGALTVRDDIRVADLVQRTPSEGLDLTGIVGRALTFAALAFGSGDSLAVADRSGAIGLWNARSKQRDRVLLGHDDLVNDLSFSADGRWIVSASSDGMARRWDLGQFGTHPWAFGADGRVIRDLAFSGQRPWLVTAGSDGVRRFDVASRNAANELLATAQSEFGVLDVSEDGHWLAAGRDDGAVLLWGAPFQDRPPEPTQLRQFTEKVNVISFSRDNQWLAVGSDDRRIHLWHLNPGTTPLLTIDYRHAGEVTELSFSPDSTWLATGSSAGDVAVWRLRPEAQPKASTQLSDLRGRVMALAFDPRGQLAIALDDGKVRLWDADRMQWSMGPWQVRTLLEDVPENDSRQSTEYVSNLAFSPDGRWLIAGTIFERLLTRQMAGTSSWREFFGRLKGRSTRLPMDLASRRATAASGAKGAVTALVFSADGRFANSISDRPVTIEMVEGPLYSTELWGPTRKIWKLAFSGSQTSDQFIGAVAEDRAWVWSVASERRSGGQPEITQLACRAAGRPPAPQTCDDLQARLSALPNWDVCGVCPGFAGR